MVKRAREYYHKLYSSERPHHHLRQRENQHLSHDFPEITACEVRLLIKQMKKGKAQAPDNITLDLITDGDEPVQVSLVRLFNESLKKSKMPEEWNKAIFILLNKKIPRDMNNQRPISLLMLFIRSSPELSLIELQVSLMKIKRGTRRLLEEATPQLTTYKQ
ncbi:uncharacterized protein [Macrobrachium rosenbergii]|uniref:uncharacterized protein n=1 Tax=Macrobrachium rosenbergii TaxID=79674 RepID=UPI0034D51237